jgi:hypothetical protein
MIANELTYNFKDVITACTLCGQKVSSDSIHTCSPQYVFAPLNPPFAGSWVIGGNWHINVTEKPSEEHIKNTELWFGWKWKDNKKAMENDCK